MKWDRPEFCMLVQKGQKHETQHSFKLYRIIKNQGFIFEKYQNAHEDSNFRKTFDFKQISYG